MMGSAAINERYANRVGERIGHLTFAGIAAERADSNRLLGVFVCDCGGTKQYPLGRVLNGKSRNHCGCKTDYGSHRTHGMRGSHEYSSWMAMKGRCLDTNHKDYPKWGALGVTICSEWVASFQDFYNDAGPRPFGTTLDRIDNSKGYQPGNVRWATPAEQASNRRNTWIVEINGTQYHSIEAAGRAHFVSATTIKRWCNGFRDQRRSRASNNGITLEKPGCRMWRKYAD